MGIYAKGDRGKCDKVFSRLVRARGKCEKCGADDYSKLQCAHIVSRVFSATRCDLENAWCLCASCHALLTREPFLHVAFAYETKGEDGYARLREKARTPSKVDWAEKLVELRALARELEAA